jgi:hypothetical protein
MMTYMTGGEFFGLIVSQYADLFSRVIQYGFTPLWYVAPFVLPPLMVVAIWRMWLRYIRAKFLADQQYIVLEVKIPTEITKTPLAMEVFLSALHQTGGESTWYSRYVEGKLRPWFSLELVSTNGEVRFFIWTREFFREVIEAQIYAQYPSVEVMQVPDYTANVPYGKPETDWQLWGCEFELTQPDPIPIKTYVDYGLDKPMKEEEKIDPMTATLEFLGSLRSYEQAWIQIIVRATKGKEKRGLLFTSMSDWKQEAAAVIEGIKKKYERPAPPGQESAQGGYFMMTKGDQDLIAAIERNTSKLGFDTGIRALYLARDEHFRAVNIAGLAGSMRQYSSTTLNGLKPTRVTQFDYPWQDYKDFRMSRRKARIFDAYRRRAYFIPPYRREWFIFNAEEIATLYHFPGSVAATPTLERITSRRSEPPANLPL